MFSINSRSVPEKERFFIMGGSWWAVIKNSEFKIQNNFAPNKHPYLCLTELALE